MKKSAWKFLALMFLFACACKPRENVSAVKDADGAEPPGESETFRDVFLGCLKETHGPVQQTMKDFVIYQPTSELMSAANAEASSGEGFLAAIDQAMRGVKPADLYQQGTQTESHPVSPEALNASLASRPMTIVILPGVFGEFIDTRAFDDVFARKYSTYAKEVAAKIAAYRQGGGGGDDQAESYSLRELGNVTLPIENVVTVGSIDDDEGRALVNVILLNTPPLSMESLGDISEKAGIFTARLTKFFNIAGTPERIMLLGYSRGAPVGLDMMAAPSFEDWRRNVTAVVSLGGVLFGSAIADQAKDPESPTARQLAALQELKNSLVEKKTAFVGNSRAWWKFAQAMGQLNSPAGASTSSLEEIEALYADSKGVDLGSGANLFFRYYKEFGLTSPLKDYVRNIQRFKKLADEMTLAVTGLGTDQRLAWWRSHKIKIQGVRYYAIAATMDDPATSPLGDKLMTNPYTYDAGSYDYKFLVKSYNDFAKASGTAVNDSQVSLLRTHAWPNLIEALNGQRPDSEFLGVMGTHHWGLALKVVSKMANGQTNPFPRVELLKALAAYEARHPN